MERVIRAAQNTDLLLLLEDDVVIHPPTNLSRLEHDLNGVVLVNHTLYPLWSKIVRVIREEHGRDLHDPVCYSGLGGTFARAAKLRGLEEHTWRAWIPRFEEAEGNSLACDELLSAMVYSIGCTIGDYSGLSMGQRAS
jgi:hypothetical protein